MNEQILLALVGIGGVLLRHYIPGLGKYLPGGSPAPSPVAPSPWVPTPQPIPIPVPTVPVKAITDCLEWSARARAKLVPVTEADRAALVSLDGMIHDLLTPPPAPTPATAK